MAAGSILHRGGQCLHDDQRLLLCESSFKLSRLLTLWVQLWLYSVGIGVLAAVTGIVPAAEVSTHYYLTLLFPVTMGHYWFLTAYLFLYILLPFVGIGLRRMTKQQFQVALVLLFVTFCLLKSVLPFRLEEDGKGYDCLWYLCVFCAAAYLRRFGIPFYRKIPGIIVVSDRYLRNLWRSHAFAPVLFENRQSGADPEDSV